MEGNKIDTDVLNICRRRDISSDFTGAPQWAAWMAIVFCSLGFLVGLFNLFDRRPQIILNEVGIFDRTTSKEIINWGIIQDAQLMEIHKQKFISLLVDEAYEPSRKKGIGWRKIGAKLNKSLGFQELNISLSAVKVDEQKLAEFIIAMTQADNVHGKNVTSGT